MRKTGLWISILTVGLIVAFLYIWYGSGGIVLDDFNVARAYPPCCGEYGAYYSFEKNIVQNGSGTLVISGSANDSGGFYRDQKGKVLWDLSGYSKIVVRAKVLAGNEAEDFMVVFRDANQKRMFWKFPFSALTSNKFTALSKPLKDPDWTDGDANNPFDYARIISMDVYGNFTEVALPFRLELDSIEVKKAFAPSAVALAGGKEQQKKAAAEAKKEKEGKPVVAEKAIMLTNLPEHIQALFMYYEMEPIWSDIIKLTPADKGLLLQLYRQEPSLAKKRNLTRALGFIGDEEVVEVFKHTLSDQYAGQKLSVGKGDNETDEELGMQVTVSALGFLAGKSDSAYELLKKGANWKFWKDYCKFTPVNGVNFYGRMADSSITGIGHSGRPDATNVLQTLKSQLHYDGPWVDAGFAYDMIRQQGMDRYRYLYFHFDQCMAEFHNWTVQGNDVKYR
jgi:hypothetical protein